MEHVDLRTDFIGHRGGRGRTRSTRGRGRRFRNRSLERSRDLTGSGSKDQCSGHETPKFERS